MSDPMREALLEKLLNTDRKAIVVSPDGAGGLCLLMSGCIQVSLPREEATALSQEILRALADGEPSWDGWGT